MTAWVSQSLANNAQPLASLSVASGMTRIRSYPYTNSVALPAGEPKGTY